MGTKKGQSRKTARKAYEKTTYPKKIIASKAGKKFTQKSERMEYTVEYRDGIPVIFRGGKWLRIDKFLLAWSSD